MDKACKDCIYFRKSGTRCTCALDNCLVLADGTCAEWEPACSLKDAGENTAEECQL